MLLVRCCNDTHPRVHTEEEQDIWISVICRCFLFLLLYKCNGLPSLCSLLPLVLLLNLHSLQKKSTKDKSSDIIYVYKYCYIFSQVKTTIEIFCYVITETNRVDKDELDI